VLIVFGKQAASGEAKTSLGSDGSFDNHPTMAIW
jgi:hypothetical protein